MDDARSGLMPLRVLATVTRDGMPVVSRFFGITIRMYQNDHAPPHFHATYAGSEALIGIGTGVVLKGRLPARVIGLVVEWALEHENELRENWHLGREQKPLVTIRPLE